MVTTALGLYNKDLNSNFCFWSFSLLLYHICKVIGIIHTADHCLEDLAKKDLEMKVFVW